MMRPTAVFTGALLVLTLLACTQIPQSPVPADDASTGGTGIPGAVQRVLDLYVPGDDDPLPYLESHSHHDPPSLNDSQYAVYAVTFLWGTFSPHPEPRPATNWSGRAHVNGEAKIHLLQTIRFEPGEDSVFQDDRPAHLAWRSFAANDFDGLTMLVFLDLTVTYIVPPELFFETLPIRLHFPFERLEALDAFFHTGPWSGVAVHARRLRPQHCPHGTLAGRWTKAEHSDAEGRFEGVWKGPDDRPIGHLMGRFWTNEEGRGRLAGVVVNPHNQETILGLEGVWHYDDHRLCPMCGAAHGVFEGRFKMAAGDGEGRFAGVFGDWNLPPDQRSMPFMGRWRMHCPNDATDHVVVAQD